MRSCLVAAAALALSACASTDDDSGDASSSTGAVAAADPKPDPDPDPDPEETTSTGEDTSTGGDTSSTGDGSSEAGDSSSSSSTGDASSTGEPGSVCGDGVVEGAEACDDGQETVLCDDDCTLTACGDAKLNAAAGEACDDGNVDDLDACIAGCIAASCGDGFQQAGVEECDDGNTAPGDGCDESCARERWASVGVAKDVAVADLYGWKQCWSDTYTAGKTVDSLVQACKGDHVMLACRPVGSDTLTLAAHAPRLDVFHEPQVDYKGGKRHAANGVAWAWAPYEAGLVGFAPGGNAANCGADGQDEQMCWLVGGNLPMTFVAGYRCGPLSGMSVAQTQQWERVAYQAWD